MSAGSLPIAQVRKGRHPWPVMVGCALVQAARRAE